jgi:hypothetical protein
MKKGLLLLSFLIISIIGISQSNNEKRLSVIETEIKSAVAAEDFELAAKLKKEQKLRLEIKEAISNQDFDKAERLKNEINGVSSAKKPSENTAVEQTVIETKSGGNSNGNQTNINPRSRKVVSSFVLFSPLGVGLSDISETSFALSFKVGNKFYFNSKSDSKWKFGIEAEWINPTIYTDFDNVFAGFSFIKPGFATSVYFNEKMGLDIGLNAGAHIFNNLDEIGDFDGFDDVGLDFTIHSEFFINKFAVGLTFQNFAGFVNDTRNVHLGVSIGFRL